LEVELERTVVVVMARRKADEERDSEWIRLWRTSIEMAEEKNVIAIGKDERERSKGVRLYASIEKWGEVLNKLMGTFMAE
jgi:hypothetical protein